MLDYDEPSELLDTSGSLTLTTLTGLECFPRVDSTDYNTKYLAAA